MKKRLKKYILGIFIACMVIGVVALQPPQKAYANWWDDATDFYSVYGKDNKNLDSLF